MHNPIRRVTMALAAGSLLLLMGAAAPEQEGFWNAVNAGRQLFETTDYLRAMDSIEQASKLALTEDQRITVALYEGLISASLGRRYQAEATSAFRLALMDDPWSKLPSDVEVSAPVQHLFEEVRESVRKGLVPRTPALLPAEDSRSPKGRKENLGSAMKKLKNSLRSQDYKQALEEVERARKLIRNKEHDSAVSLLEGVVLASLGQQRLARATSAFQKGLALNPRVELPVRVSAAVERDFEELRARLFQDMEARAAVPPEDKSAWKLTGSMLKPRESHTATLLNSGHVLVAGGVNDSGGLSDSELYDPKQATWSPTDSMTASRHHHTATLLQTGEVLVVGGENDEEGVLSSVELYDPKMGTWSLVGPMSVARHYHTATLLPSGRVLVTGGEDATGERLSSAEIYDPVTGVWTVTDRMSTDRLYHEAVSLPSGRVLVLGGISAEGYLSSAEEYDPELGKWSPCQNNLPLAISEHRATLLNSGRILITGGDDGTTGQAATAIYNPATATFSAGAPLNMGRVAHTLVELNSGNVLVMGGVVNDTASPLNAEVYNVNTGKFAPTVSMHTARDRFTATLLSSGEVLIAGGSSNGTPVSSAELYQP